MSKIIAYKNTDRHCFSQIRFDSRERILISVATTPVHSIKVIKLLAGIIPYKTVWEFSLPEGVTNGQRKLIALFTDQSDKKSDHPLDAITKKLLTCRSCNEAARVLQQAERS
ncbi:MAG: hypothetical protein Q8K68_10040 [Nitrospirota bacterium]|nr:hypothetical protein [Nitrospirota bacterium]